MKQADKRRSYGIMAFTAACCGAMALVETAIEPPYIVKSAIKAALFLVLPIIIAKAAHIKLFDRSFSLNRKRIAALLALGALLYGVIIGAYALTRDLFDYASLVQSLSADQKVDSGSFIWVALYISFCNSFLEEFLFRLLSFLQLSKYTSKKIAYAFSSVIFAVYHIAMIGPSFPPLLLLLALIGLTAGGCLFDYADDKAGTIYNSWVIHMAADFAIMTIWYRHI